MRKLSAIVAAGAALAFMSAPALGNTISFADYAAGNEGGIVNATEIDFGGTVIGFISGDQNGTAYHPYFDDVSGGKPAGLGVCRVLAGDGGVGAPGADCANPGDDSIDGEGGSIETIALFFADPYGIDGIVFRDGDHNWANNSAGLINWEVAMFSGTTGLQQSSIADFVAMVIGGAFDEVTSMTFGFVDTDFYIESIYDAPIPAALPLLLSGVAGLAFASRRRKKA